jgi:biotin operon repressor/anti-sigma regulatory factor (Ser/Thr protein kinase)
MGVRQSTVEIRQFIIHMVKHHPADIATVTRKRFGISRQAVHKHIKELCSTGVLLAAGTKNSKGYQLCPLAHYESEIPLTPETEEDVPWQDHIRPLLKDVSPNILGICGYAFTEMLNNAIDHSESPTAKIRCTYTAESICIDIIDKGVGIFKKIKQCLHLHDEREAILELAKGKLTTDPVRHTGEGVFFTSRMVDLFSISSGTLYFTHIRPDSDWLIEVDQPPIEGTTVQFVVSLKSKLQTKELFDQYSDNPEEITFSRTHVPISLAQFGPDTLISRSQAKRILTRFNRFKEVLLDFSGVEFIGQAFADEIFRVFQTAHPEVRLIAINAAPSVSGMIRRAIAARDERQLMLFDNEDQ